jgi:glycerophosphoryl diester phosphodiesterase
VTVSVPDLIAHRGYAARQPENTLAAVRAALDVGARLVEVDVQLSADGVPFLFHDRTLERLCGVRGALAELPALAAAELTVRGEPVPSLERAIVTFAERDAHVFVELKRVSLEAFGADAVLDAVLPQLTPLDGRCTLISFDLGVLERARARCAHPLGPVLDAWDQRNLPEVTALEPDVVFCNVNRLPLQGALDVPGGRLAVYEIDDPQTARDLHARGAALIETFAIGEMLAALGGAA